jgi:O-antigen/teichoic acid export membrane protein
MNRISDRKSSRLFGRAELLKLLRSGSFWNMMGSGMMAANTVILSMLVGHFFDLNEVGMFSLALTTAQVLYSLALFGANDLQMTDYHQRFHFNHYFWVKMLSTMLAAVACIGTILGLRITGTARTYTVLLTGFMLVNSFAELYQSMFFQQQRLDLSGKALFYRYLSSTVAFLAVFLLTRSIISGCVWMLLVDIAVTLWWILRYAKSFRDSSYAPDWTRTKKLVRDAFPLCISVIGSLLIVNGPKYLINAYLSDEIQGAYSILFMPVYAINLLSQFVFKPFFHRYSQVLQKDKKSFFKLFLPHTLSIGGFAFCGGTVMWLIGTPLLRILFGQDLRAYRTMMFLFLLSGGALAMNQLLYYIMVILCRQNLILRNYLVGMIFTLLVGVIFVPRLMITGAWLSFTAGQVSLLIGYLWILRCHFAAAKTKNIAE